MSDIFISYASQDRPKAQVLAQALVQHGWSVWWDRTIPTGKRFDQVIAEALAGARCILVLWSKQSVTSDWVVEEAEEGRKRQILVPVLIENVLPPMGFRRIQAADLIDWDGAGTSPAFQGLVGDIAAILGPPLKTLAPKPAPPKQEPPVEPPRPEPPPRPFRPSPVRKVLPWFIAVAVLAGGFVAFWAFQVGPPRPVTVQVPSVIKRDQKEVMAILSKSELRVGTITNQAAKGVPDGIVLDQQPAAGTLVERNTAIDLIVSKEPLRAASVQVPSVVKRDQKDAVAILANSGLRVGKIAKRETTGVTPGTVLEQQPTGGTMVERNSQVNLIVAEAPPRKTQDTLRLVSISPPLGSRLRSGGQTDFKIIFHYQLNTAHSAILMVGTQTYPSSKGGCSGRGDPSGFEVRERIPRGERQLEIRLPSGNPNIGFLSLYAYFWDSVEWDKGNKALIKEFREFNDYCYVVAAEPPGSTPREATIVDMEMGFIQNGRRVREWSGPCPDRIEVYADLTSDGPGVASYVFSWATPVSQQYAPEGRKKITFSDTRRLTVKTVAPTVMDGWHIGRFWVYTAPNAPPLKELRLNCSR